MDKNNIDTSLAELEEQLIQEDNIDEINRIVELFNLNLQKKNIIRSAKLSSVQDKIVNHIEERIALEPESIDDRDLIGYHKAIQDTLNKSDTSMENVKVPTIQINQQVNVDKITFDSDSRKRILAAVNGILNSEDADLEALKLEGEE